MIARKNSVIAMVVAAVFIATGPSFAGQGRGSGGPKTHPSKPTGGTHTTVAKGPSAGTVQHGSPKGPKSTSTMAGGAAAKAPKTTSASPKSGTATAKATGKSTTTRVSQNDRASQVDRVSQEDRASQVDRISQERPSCQDDDEHAGYRRDTDHDDADACAAEAPAEHQPGEQAGDASAQRHRPDDRRRRLSQSRSVRGGRQCVEQPRHRFRESENQHGGRWAEPGPVDSDLEANSQLDAGSLARRISGDRAHQHVFDDNDCDNDDDETTAKPRKPKSTSGGELND